MGQNSTGTRCRGFLVLESRCRGFLVFEPQCCDNVPPRPRFRYHGENKKTTHNYVNYVVEKYFNIFQTTRFNHTMIFFKLTD